MSFTLNDNFLSAWKPVRFTYNEVDKSSYLNGEFKPLRSNFFYFDHQAFRNFKDAALSKKTCVVLTDVKPFNNIFDSEFTSEVVKLGKLSGSFNLKSLNKFLTEKNGKIYRGTPCGNSNKPILITVSSIDEKHAELRIGSKFLEIDSTYPYTAKLVDSQTSGELRYRRFEVEYQNNKISFKIKTREGYRFLAFGIDNVLRAVGLELNETSVNNYHFDVVTKTRSALERGVVLANAEPKQIKYHNNFENQKYNLTVDINSSIEKPHNYLITCSTLRIVDTEIPVANVANLKTNYTPLGTFLI